MSNLNGKFVQELKFTQMLVFQDNFTSVTDMTLILFITHLIDCDTLR